MKEGILTKPDQTKYKQVFDWDNDKSIKDITWEDQVPISEDIIK